MRAVLALVLVGGCSFRAGVAPSTAPGDDASSTGSDAQVQSDARPLDARPLDARPLDARPLDARPLDARPLDAPPDAAKCPGYAAIAGAPATSRYKLFGWSATPAQDNSTTFATASQTCTNDGAHLVIINNTAEADALRSAITVDPALSYFWLGITDAATEGTWLTVLGGAAPYLPWAIGQPNGFTAQNCAVEYTSDGTFYDYYCANTFPFACECE